MDDETTSRSVDGTPWPEARPPHLPDRLTAMSPWLIPFLLLAAVQVVVGWQRWVGEGALDVVPSLAVQIADRVPGLAATLLGAALFWRHPQAHRTLPMVARGVALLAAAELLRLASGPLSRMVEYVSIGTEDLLTTPFQAASFLFVAPVTVFGIVYLARGLRAARWSEDVGSVRGPAIALTAVSVISTAIAASSTVTASYDDLGLLGIMVVASSIIVSLAFKLAWSYLLVVALGGWFAEERPRIGWLLVAFGAAILLLHEVVVAVSVLLAISEPGRPNAFLVIVVSYIAGWLALLLGFVVGLPSATPDRPAVTTPGSGGG